MSFASMNGINQTRALMGGMQRTQRQPQPGPAQQGLGMTPGPIPNPTPMGAGVNPAPAATVNQTGRVGMMGSQVGSATANMDRSAYALPQQQAPLQQAPAPTPFDPNDPRNAALAGYMA